jgi:uncharacterized protein
VEGETAKQALTPRDAVVRDTPDEADQVATQCSFHRCKASAEGLPAPVPSIGTGLYKPHDSPCKAAALDRMAQTGAVQAPARQRGSRGLRPTPRRLTYAAAINRGRNEGVVKLSIVPRDREFFRLFSEFSATLEKAAGRLVEMFDGFERAKAKKIAREIVELEHHGDKIVHDIVQRLNKAFITPLDREDIYDLATTLDEIMDNIEATADMMIIYRIEQPLSHAAEQAALLAEATKVLHGAIDKLEKRKGVREDCIEINRLENDGDRIVRDAIAELFDGDMKCTDIIKWKDIYETLEKAIDECEHVANTLETVILKNT